MKTFVVIFLSSFLLYVTATPVSRSSSFRLTSHNQQFLRDLICILKGKTASECLDDGNIGLLPPSTKRLANSGGMEEEGEAPEGLLPHGIPDRRDAFYSDWRRRK